MADTLDPATMDALNALGDEIAAEASPEAIEPEPQQSEPASEDAAAEPQEGQETTAENADGEQGEDAGEGEPAARKPKRSGVEKDVQRLLRERYEARNRQAEAEAKAADLQRQIEELKAARQPAQDAPPAAGQTQQPPVVQQRGETGQDFEARVQAEAARRSKVQAFDDACNKVATKGIEAHKNFADAQGALVGAFGRQISSRPEFLQAIVKLENGHDVFHHLGTNLEAAEAMFAHTEPVDLVMAMGELSAKLKTPKAQKVSNAPSPVNPIRGGANNNRASVRLEDDKTPMDDWSKQFLKDMAS